MKPIYKPEKMYTDDINDLVEMELAKGGIGSGIRGHRTAKKQAQKQTSNRQAPTGSKTSADKVADALRAEGVKIKNVVRAEDPEQEDDAVHISDKVHVQVQRPSGGIIKMGVVAEHSDGTFLFFPVRANLKAVVADIKDAENGKARDDVTKVKI